MEVFLPDWLCSLSMNAVPRRAFACGARVTMARLGFRPPFVESAEAGLVPAALGCADWHPQLANSARPAFFDKRGKRPRAPA
jgi:hypothetical protein